MLQKVLISLVGCIAAFSVYTSLSVKKENEGIRKEMVSQQVENSRLIDSIVKVYRFKTDSLYLSNDTLFSSIDSNILYLDNSMSEMVKKTNVNMDSITNKDIDEALLWINSLKDY